MIDPPGDPLGTIHWGQIYLDQNEPIGGCPQSAHFDPFWDRLIFYAHYLAFKRVLETTDEK
ncbi:MAG TPA: hypothetical protein DDX03_06810 [Firmicutes bacterium]|jgi:hypothetical protein|nr:hypothetical protein [Bacillota bacterium]HBL50537.1 hypothetical protein [Bacillota bacterium]HCF88932.1 hypothetical protein [Bacillota bacterium]